MADIEEAFTRQTLALVDKNWPGWSAAKLATIFSIRSTAYPEDDEQREHKSEQDLDRAFHYLRLAINEGFRGFTWMSHNHDYDPMRGDDRWGELMKLVKKVQKEES